MKINSNIKILLVVGGIGVSILSINHVMSVEKTGFEFYFEDEHLWMCERQDQTSLCEDISMRLLEFAYAAPHTDEKEQLNNSDYVFVGKIKAVKILSEPIIRSNGHTVGLAEYHIDVIEFQKGNSVESFVAIGKFLRESEPHAYETYPFEVNDIVKIYLNKGDPPYYLEPNQIRSPLSRMIFNCNEAFLQEIPTDWKYHCYPEPMGNPLRDEGFNDHDHPTRLQFIEDHCAKHGPLDYVGELRYLNSTHLIDLDTCEWAYQTEHDPNQPYEIIVVTTNGLTFEENGEALSIIGWAENSSTEPITITEFKDEPAGIVGNCGIKYLNVAMIRGSYPDIQSYEELLELKDQYVNFEYEDSDTKLPCKGIDKVGIESVQLSESKPVEITEDVMSKGLMKLHFGTDNPRVSMSHATITYNLAKGTTIELGGDLGYGKDGISQYYDTEVIREQVSPTERKAYRNAYNFEPGKYTVVGSTMSGSISDPVIITLYPSPSPESYDWVWILLVLIGIAAGFAFIMTRRKK